MSGPAREDEGEKGALTPLLLARRRARLTEGREAWARRNPIASDLADCGLRYQVMALRGWALRPPPDEAGAGRMENGRVQEAAMLRQLQDEGWEVVEQQAPFEIYQPVVGKRRRILSGKSDGKLRLPPTGPGRPPGLIPLEVKDTSEWNLAAIETESDLRSRSRWTRKWWRQMQAYMIGHGYERALIMLGARGERRFVEVAIDWDEAERILAWCASAVELDDRATEASVQPEALDAWLTDLGVPHAADPSECTTCHWKDRICHPPDPKALARDALRPELEREVERLLELAPLKAEHERLAKRLKEETEGAPLVVAGRFIGTGQVRTRRMKEQPAKPAYVSEYWEMKWQAPGTNGEADE